jgi:hypothetical protein
MPAAEFETPNPASDRQENPHLNPFRIWNQLIYYTYIERKLHVNSKLLQGEICLDIVAGKTDVMLSPGKTSRER